MNKLVDSDMYLAFVKRDLTKRNPLMSEGEILEIVFNSNVLESYEFERQYVQQLQKQVNLNE